MLNDLLAALAPHLIEALLALVAALLAYGIKRISMWTGAQIEAKHAAALHSAIRTATLAALQRGLSGTGLQSSVRAYVEASVPDALSKLRPAESVLGTLINAKAAELRAENFPLSGK